MKLRLPPNTIATWLPRGLACFALTLCLATTKAETLFDIPINGSIQDVAHAGTITTDGDYSTNRFGQQLSSRSMQSEQDTISLSIPVVSGSSQPRTKLTVAFWLRINPLGSTHNVLKASSDGTPVPIINVNSSGDATFTSYTGNTYATMSAAAATNNWLHIGLVWTPGTIAIYTNGSLLTTASTTEIPPTSLTFGSPHTEDQFDEILVLSHAEPNLTALINNTAPTIIAPPIITPDAGSYAGGISVQITGSGICYYKTTDDYGNPPSDINTLDQWIQYTGPFTVYPPCEVRAKASNTTGDTSGETIAVYQNSAGSTAPLPLPPASGIYPTGLFAVAYPHEGTLPSGSFVVTNSGSPLSFGAQPNRLYFRARRESETFSPWINLATGFIMSTNTTGDSLYGTDSTTAAGEYCINNSSSIGWNQGMVLPGQTFRNISGNPTLGPNDQFEVEWQIRVDNKKPSPIVKRLYYGSAISRQITVTAQLSDATAGSVRLVALGASASTYSAWGTYVTLSMPATPVAKNIIQFQPNGSTTITSIQKIQGNANATTIHAPTFPYTDANYLDTFYTLITTSPATAQGVATYYLPQGLGFFQQSGTETLSVPTACGKSISIPAYTLNDPATYGLQGWIVKRSSSSAQYYRTLPNIPMTTSAIQLFGVLQSTNTIDTTRTFFVQNSNVCGANPMPAKTTQYDVWNGRDDTYAKTHTLMLSGIQNSYATNTGQAWALVTTVPDTAPSTSLGGFQPISDTWDLLQLIVIRNTINLNPTDNSQPETSVITTAADLAFTTYYSCSGTACDGATVVTTNQTVHISTLIQQQTGEAVVFSYPDGSPAWYSNDRYWKIVANGRSQTYLTSGLTPTFDAQTTVDGESTTFTGATGINGLLLPTYQTAAVGTNCYRTNFTYVSDNNAIVTGLGLTSDASDCSSGPFNHLLTWTTTGTSAQLQIGNLTPTDLPASGSVNFPSAPATFTITAVGPNYTGQSQSATTTTPVTSKPKSAVTNARITKSAAGPDQVRITLNATLENIDSSFSKITILTNGHAVQVSPAENPLNAYIILDSPSQVSFNLNNLTDTRVCGIDWTTNASIFQLDAPTIGRAMLDGTALASDAHLGAVVYTITNNAGATTHVTYNNGTVTNTVSFITPTYTLTSYDPVFTLEAYTDNTMDIASNTNSSQHAIFSTNFKLAALPTYTYNAIPLKIEYLPATHGWTGAEQLAATFDPAINNLTQMDFNNGPPTIIIDGNNLTNNGSGAFQTALSLRSTPDTWPPASATINDIATQDNGTNSLSTRFDVGPLNVMPTTNADQTVDLLINSATVNCIKSAWQQVGNIWTNIAQSVGATLVIRGLDPGYLTEFRGNKANYNGTTNKWQARITVLVSVDSCSQLVTIHANQNAQQLTVTHDGSTQTIASGTAAQQTIHTNMPDGTYTITATGSAGTASQTITVNNADAFTTTFRYNSQTLENGDRIQTTKNQNKIDIDITHNDTAGIIINNINYRPYTTSVTGRTTKISLDIAGITSDTVQPLDIRVTGIEKANCGERRFLLTLVIQRTESNTKFLAEIPPSDPGVAECMRVDANGFLVPWNMFSGSNLTPSN